MKQFGIHIRKCLSVLLVCVILGGFATPAFAAPKKGDILIVTADYARMRNQPKSGSAVIHKLSRGNKVKFLANHSGWFRIELSSGKTGFMYKSFLNASGVTSPSIKVGQIYRSKASRLPVHKKASSGSKVKGRIKSSARLVLIEKHGKWGLIRIVSSGKVGYVQLSKLKKA